MLMYRQGDVLLLRVDPPRPPGDFIPRTRGRLVIAEGEATGHSHSILDPDAGLFTTEDELYLEVTGPVRVVHEEHDPILIAEPGTYKVIRQREYQLDGGFSNVRD